MAPKSSFSALRLIPEDMLQKPAVVALTASEQFAMAAVMGIPVDKALRLERDVALTMPDMPCFRGWVQYVESLERRGMLPPHARFGIMIEELAEWRRTHGEDAFRATLTSLQNSGHPHPVWSFVHHLGDGTSSSST